jgi:hypothetical protein
MQYGYWRARERGYCRCNELNSDPSFYTNFPFRLSAVRDFLLNSTEYLSNCHVLCLIDRDYRDNGNEIFKGVHDVN